MGIYADFDYSKIDNFLIANPFRYYSNFDVIFNNHEACW